jgi:hypothetical protein
MKEFLDFLFKNFKVAVWTSNIAANAESIVSLAFGERVKRLEFIYNREQCDLGANYSSKKDLRRIWNRYPEFTPDNTYIIDDEEDKILESQRSNYIYIPPFKPEVEDKCLVKMMEFLTFKFLGDQSPVHFQNF